MLQFLGTIRGCFACYCGGNCQRKLGSVAELSLGAGLHGDHGRLPPGVQEGQFFVVRIGLSRLIKSSYVIFVTSEGIRKFHEI